MQLTKCNQEMACVIKFIVQSNHANNMATQLLYPFPNEKIGTYNISKLNYKIVSLSSNIFDFQGMGIFGPMVARLKHS